MWNLKYDTNELIYRTEDSKDKEQSFWASLVAQLVKNPPARQEILVQFLGWEDLLKKGTAIHSSILA